MAQGDDVSIVKMSRMQEIKLRYLIKKGGIPKVNVSVRMLDGSVATIDQFGKVVWQDSNK